MAADAGNIRMGDGNVPAWGGAGEGSLFFDSADGQLYYRRSDDGTVVGPLGAPPIGTKYWLENNEHIVVPPRYQYLLKGAVVLDGDASITADTDGQVQII